ncbi:MAG TPA: ATP-binding protein [Candidatus Sulfotelmatobacter sp.]|nr:ATP-binding protein [Candidatus Sulfotelmatobacter sp.]
MEPTSEIKRLQSCINDLISVLALPAIWSGSKSSHILGTLLDVLVTMLRLDFAYARLGTGDNVSPLEVVRGGDYRHSSTQAQQFAESFNHWLRNDQADAPCVIPDPAGEGEVFIAAFSLGLQQDAGMLVAGSRRADFPTEVERLLLRVAANQAGIGLQEARRSDEQKRTAEILEQRVTERTSLLTAVNEELRRSKTYLAEAQKLSHTGSFGWKTSTGEITWSDETFRIFQLDWTTTPTVELILQRVHPEDVARVRQTIEHALLNGKNFELEHRLLMPNGSVKHLHVVASSFSNHNGGVEFAGAVMDITERKRAEDERERLRQAQADLAHVNRVSTMGELTASLAHEVNQPIAAAVTDANTCLRWLTRDQPDMEEARQAALRVVKDATRAAEIITRTRLLFRKVTPQSELVNVNEIIQEMIMLLHSEATRYSITIRTELAELPQVIGDRVQLQQVLMNLVANGIDAMKDVDGTRELAIKSQKAEDGQLLISISDTGVGLPPRHLDQIFNAFFTTKPHGTGMGLRISRSIVESHGGRLWATDNSRRGASFYIALPAQVEAA